MQIHPADIPGSELLIGEGIVELLAAGVAHAAEFVPVGSKLRQALLDVVSHQVRLSHQLLSKVQHGLDGRLAGRQLSFLYRQKKIS